jgi:hypothetical protein
VTEENQKVLDVVQIEAFHHDRFVEDQVRHFMSLVKPAGEGRQVIVDVGGGIGLFAHRLRQLSGHELRVFDLDAASVDKCDRLGVPCTVGDALTPRFAGDEQIATFNMMLHHLVAQSEPATRELQKRALTAWRGRADRLFVNEYIYESWVGNLSGWLIYQITKSRVLSWIGRVVSTVVPSLRANTFGVGVRFRAVAEWRRLFADAGYRVTRHVEGEPEAVALPQRLLLIKTIRRDSFLLEPDTR